MKLNPYLYEDLTAEDFRNALRNADEKKLIEFEKALSNERERRKNLKEELLESLQIVFDNIEDEDFVVTYDGFPIQFALIDVKPNC